MQGFKLLSVALLAAVAPLATAQNDFVAESTDATNPQYGSIPTPSRYQSAGFRFWMPGGWVESDVLVTEIQAAYDAGFGRLEISDVEDSIQNGTTYMPASIYGWAPVPRWNDAILSAYETAADLGLHLDYTIGPHWPTGFPGYTPDSPETSKELVHGQVLVTNGSYSGSLPLPEAEPSGVETANPTVNATAMLVAVLVAQTNTTNSSASVIDFDPDTLVDITSTVVGNDTIDWTAPSDGNWILVAVYGRGTGQIENMYDMNAKAPRLYTEGDGFGLIVDHLSYAGVQATIDYWEENILTDEMKTLMAGVNASYFEDSLELKLHQYWTLNMTTEFETRRGYSLIPYLLYLLEDTNTFSGNDTVYDALLNDWYRTITDLYVGYRVVGIKEWAHTFGVHFRNQPYTIVADGCYGASVVDIPEGESLGFGSDYDMFRIEAAGRDIAGRTPILSCEMGANFGEAYYLTWRDLLTIFNIDASVGVNQAVIHGYPYRDSPTSVWPGYAPFTPIGTQNGFADAWGVRQPQWLFANNASTYMNNGQLIMQSGTALTDVAILNTLEGLSITWDDPALNLAGYSYTFPSPLVLLSYGATVKDKRLVPDGPSYGALVLDDITGLNLDITKAIHKWAKAGLPIVFVGAYPTTIAGITDTWAKDNAKVEEIFTEIAALTNTVLVDTQADVPAALSSLGVSPSVKYSSETETFYTQRRNLGNGDSVFWVVNMNDTTVTQTVSLSGKGYPLALDLWSGKVVPIPVFTTSSDGYISVELTLASNQAQAIYLGKTNPYGAKAPSAHLIAISDNTTAVVTEAGSIALRTTSNGTFSATLASGKSKSFDIDNVATPITPSWTLTVEDWNPQVTGESGINSSLTVKTLLDPIDLGTNLTVWGDIAAIEHAAGVAYYTTSVELDVPSSDEDSSGTTTGVYLDFTEGAVYGTIGLTINDNTVVYIDQFLSAPIDITDYVITGTNSITVTLTTPLWNKLILTYPTIYGSDSLEDYGIVGPVYVRYYREAIVKAA